MVEIGRRDEEPKRENESFLPDATVRARGGERRGSQSALTPKLTFDHVIARVRRAAAQCGQNPPEWLLGYRAMRRAGARCPVPPIFWLPSFNPCFPCSS
ncbi:hypothetical protein PIB30_067155 [Stylosanthes scabra]|uniref:Uncharacterized protein n=1 Tax=Stylosanthes scabra TaxID=79078 RepID=A0ABU6QMY7_9FABA|nr:hypothetical protein [Stylosanthes scabra]